MSARPDKMWVTRSGLESRHIGQRCKERDRMTRPIVPGPLPVEPIKRIIARSVREDRGFLTPCRIYTGSLRGGYGQIRIGSRIDNSCRSGRVHRIVYEYVYGEIPVGLDIDHLCRQRDCHEPLHLEAVTRRENLLRSPLTVCGRKP